jgi:hypothetical protein
VTRFTYAEGRRLLWSRPHLPPSTWSADFKLSLCVTWPPGYVVGCVSVIVCAIYEPCPGRIVAAWPLQTNLGYRVGYMSVLYINYIATREKLTLGCRLCLCSAY